MNPEKRYLWRLTAILLLFFVISLTTVKAGLAQSVNDAYRIENFDVSGDVSLEVQTSGGSITVTGTEESEVSVEMYVRRRGDYIQSGDADLSDYTIEIAKNGNTIKALAKKKSKRGWNWNNGYSISFVVYTPNSTRTRLKTSGGSVSAEFLKGSQELITSGGSINIEDIEGDAVLSTSGGSIRIKDIMGNIDANTSGGTIRVDAVVGSLDLRTSGGSISLEAIEGKVDARTSGGSINAEILAPDDYIKLRTSGGSIHIEVPENGYDLDLDGNRVNVKLVNFTGEAEKDEIQGSINGGGIEIHAKTSGGAINLDFL